MWGGHCNDPCGGNHRIAGIVYKVSMSLLFLKTGLSTNKSSFVNKCPGIHKHKTIPFVRPPIGLITGVIGGYCFRKILITCATQDWWFISVIYLINYMKD